MTNSFWGQVASRSRRQPATWPRLAMATPGPSIGRLQPAAAGAQALLEVDGGHGSSVAQERRERVRDGRELVGND